MAIYLNTDAALENYKKLIKSAYFIDKSMILDKLNISKSDSYLENLNKYNVIKLSFNEIPDNKKTYDDYISNIINNLKKDFMSIFKKRRPTGQEIFNAVMTIITTIASLFCVTSCMSRF